MLNLKVCTGWCFSLLYFILYALLILGTPRV
jgi:hypothetical protein